MQDNDMIEQLENDAFHLLIAIADVSNSLKERNNLNRSLNDEQLLLKLKELEDFINLNYFKK